MRRTRSTYWSNSEFARVVQRFVGVDKPQALELGGWRKWDAAFKVAHPLVFWFTEEFLDKLQDIVMFPADVWFNIRVYVRNRFFDKMHTLQTKLAPGEYYDLDTRILHGLFNSLVDFIECEKAWMHVVFSEERRSDLPWYARFSWLRFKTFRNPAAGLAHLEWEISLAEPDIDEHGIDQSCPPQAEAAKEQFELYNWWKHVRPNRADVYDQSGWSEISNKYDILGGEPRDEHAQAMINTSLDMVRKLEEQYDKEDEEMLIRLIKIRKTLWT